MVASENPFHKNVLSVTGFLGGITFAALVLIIQSADKLKYPLPPWLPISYGEGVLIVTAFISILFTVSTVGILKVAAGEKRADSSVARISTFLADMGFYALVIILLPSLTLPFSFAGFILLLVSGISLIIIIRISDYFFN